MLLELLKERMAFLEDLAYDKHFYAFFSSSRTIGVDYELYLQRDKKWVLRQRNSDIPLDKYPGMSAQQVIDNLGCLGINVEDVFEAISGHCFSQVCYADLVIKEATKLFGSDAIDSARKAQEQFHQELVKVIMKMTDDKELIEGDGQTTPKKIGHLKVVK